MLAGMGKSISNLGTLVWDFFVVYIPKFFVFLIEWVQRTASWLAGEYVRMRAEMKWHKVVPRLKKNILPKKSKHLLP